MNYQNIYNQIIERAKTRVLEGYKEKHHIIPRCLGGGNKKENIIELTAREHFLCHMLLCEIYPNNHKLNYALFLMSIGKNKKYEKYKFSARTYERIKIKFVEMAKGKPKPEGFGNKIKSNEKNKKIGDSNRKPKPEGFGEMMKLKLKGLKKPIGFGIHVIEMHSKPMLQYDCNGNFIKEWPSIKSIKDELGITPVSIRNTIKNGISMRSKNKFMWVYKTDKIILDKIDTTKRIYQYSIELNNIKYDSIEEASRLLNITIAAVKKKMRNENKS